jgi:hypothetical protein
MGMGVKRRIWLIFALLGMMVPFQNCAKFSTKGSSDLSAQCTAKVRAAAPSLHLLAADVGCGDFNSYTCDQRVFSPDLPDLTEQTKACLGSGSVCVDVVLHQFNTTVAQASAPASEFLPGGSYNHEEDNCYQSTTSQGVALFVGSADNMEEALSKAMAACEKAVE